MDCEVPHARDGARRSWEFDVNPVGNSLASSHGSPAPFVPHRPRRRPAASSPRRPGSRPDELILDLEDAVAADRKEAAREHRGPGAPRPRLACRHGRRPGERRAHGLARPASSSAAEGATSSSSRRSSRPTSSPTCPLPCEAQIETARGLAFCEQIAAAPGLEALVLGPGDLAASLGVPELTIGAGAHLDYALARIVGRGAGLRGAGRRRAVRRCSRTTHGLRARRAGRAARLRRQVVHPPRAGRRVQRRLRADRRRARACAADPRVERRRAPRRRDDRRG